MSNPSSTDPTMTLRPEAQLEGLYRSEHARMVRLAALLTRSHALAEEVVQEAFIHVHRRWADINDPRPYLRQVVVNEARGLLRRRAVESRHLGDPPEPSMPPEVDETWRLLGGLTPKRQVALVLRFYEDMSIDDIAVVMDCRPATVKSLIHRGLESLRRNLDAHHQ